MYVCISFMLQIKLMSSRKFYKKLQWYINIQMIHLFLCIKYTIFLFDHTSIFIYSFHFGYKN